MHASVHVYISAFLFTHVYILYVSVRVCTCRVCYQVMKFMGGLVIVYNSTHYHNYKHRDTHSHEMSYQNF